MKIIYKIDTDDPQKIRYFAKGVEDENIIVPMGSVEVYVISDDGKVTKLE